MLLKRGTAMSWLSNILDVRFVTQTLILLDVSSQANNLRKKLIKQCVDTVSDRAQGCNNDKFEA
jgi:hypothetical protein